MMRGNVRRLGAAALVLGCLIALPGQAGADDVQTFSITGPPSDQVSEGETATYTVSLTEGTDDDATVQFNATAGTGTDASDFAVTPDTLTVPEGDSRTFTVRAVEDTTNELNEPFTVSLSNPVRATIQTGSVTTTIVDDDPEPSIKPISDVTVVEGNTGTVDAVMTVELSAASGKTVTVLYTTAPGTATETPPPADYQPVSGSLVFSPGQTSKTITVKVNGDTLFEQSEKFSVVLTDPENAGPEPDNRGEITITDNDSSPTPTVTTPSVPEGNGPGLTDLVFDVTLPCPRSAVTFNYRTVADTATSSDFNEVGGLQLSFSACSTSTPATTTLPITIKIKGDALDEFDESFTLELFNPANGAVVATAKGTIVNDDNNSKLSISDATADEPGTLKFTVTLSPASGREVKVNWATANGTAAAGADYTAGSGALTFAAGETSKTIDVAVTGDSLDEANETLSVNLSGATNIPPANLLDGQGVGTIVDKNAPPSLSISDTVGREGAGATFTVTLAGTTLQEVKVNFNTADGTAKAGSDYAARGGTLTFAAGEKSKTIAVSIIDDPDAEPVEEFSVVLGDPVNGAITKSRGQGSIEASDRSLADPPATPKPVAKPVGKNTVLVPRMILGPRTVTIGANGIARMLVTCQKASPIACAGTVELERAVKPLLKLGKKTFTVRKGAKAYASIKLTARTLKILRKSGTLRAKVVVMVKTSAKTMKVSPGTITLKGTKALMKPKPKPKPKPPSTQVVVDP